MMMEMYKKYGFFKEEVNNLIRLHFARSKETLDEALGRLAKLQELLK